MPFDLDPLTAFYGLAALAAILAAEALYLLFHDTKSYRSRVNRRLAMAQKEADRSRPQLEVDDGFIGTKATLVIVPPQLCKQWENEVHKFTGKKLSVHVIFSKQDLNRTTIELLQRVDVVIMSVSVYKSDAYFDSHTTTCLEESLKKKKALAKRKKDAKEVRARAAKEAEEREKQKDATAGDDKADAESKAGDGADATITSNTKKSTAKPEETKKNKKRKADEAGEETTNKDTKEPKKKKQKKSDTKDTAAADSTPKAGDSAAKTASQSTTTTTNAKAAKPAKPKGPVNVEIQCGVPLPQGGYCARSLTCKSHSMGSKRSVPGRSAPYDQLLALSPNNATAWIHHVITSHTPFSLLELVAIAPLVTFTWSWIANQMTLWNNITSSSPVSEHLAQEVS